MTSTCTGCGEHQSGDPLGRCYDCRRAEPGYTARLNAFVRDFMKKEPRSNAEAVKRVGEPGAYRFFYADVIREPCPDCGEPTGVGFSKHDPGAEEREVTRCTECAAAGIEREAEIESEYLGYPVTDRGNCTGCGNSTQRYGEAGSPQCQECGPEPTRDTPAPEPPSMEAVRQAGVPVAQAPEAEAHIQDSLDVGI